MSELQPRILGTELELGLQAFNDKGERIDDEYLGLLMMMSLPAGLGYYQEFLSNGGRFYYDRIARDKNDTRPQGHLEYCTPECSSIREAVNYELAGEVIVLSALHSLYATGQINDFRWHKRVADSTGNYWGAHESYQVPRNLNPADKKGILYPLLSAHLATRNILTGAGVVLDNGSFGVSQKTWSLNKLMNAAAHYDRPLIDTRDKPLNESDDTRRIHVSCGDANVSPWALFMKLGTTAVIMRMAEHGIGVSDLMVKNPLALAGIVSIDYELRRTVKLTGGRKIRPVEIQAELAERAAALREKVPIPEEESKVIDEWLRATNDAIADPATLYGHADWATKLRLIERFKERRPKATKDEIKAKDFQYDLLGRTEGLGVMMRNERLYELTPPDDDIYTAISTPPPNTRANVRGRTVSAIAKDTTLEDEFIDVNWEKIEIANKGTVLLSPREPYHASIDWLISSSS